MTTSALKGLKERSFKPRYEAGIQTLSHIEGRYAIDTQGKESLVRRIKTVPVNSNAVTYGQRTQKGDARLIDTRKKETIALRDRIAAILPPAGMILGSITKLLTPEEKAMLKALKLETKEFLMLHDIFKAQGNKFYNQTNFNPDEKKRNLK